MIQGNAVVAREDEVDATVAIEVGHDGIARTPTGEAERRRRISERAVEVVAIDSALARTDEEEVEVAVVIQVREERLSRAMDVADACLGRNVDKGAIAIVAEQVTTPFGAYDEEVHPSIVVVVDERGERGAVGQ